MSFLNLFNETSLNHFSLSVFLLKKIILEFFGRFAIKERSLIICLCWHKERSKTEND